MLLEAEGRERANTSRSQRLNTSNSKCLSDLAQLLQQLGIEHYLDVLASNEVTVDILVTLSEDELEQVGVNTVGARKKILAISSGFPIGSISISSILDSTLPSPSLTPIYPHATPYRTTL